MSKPDRTLKVKIYDTPSYTYVCKANAGSDISLNSPVWQIKRISKGTDVEVLYAEGNDNFDKVASNYSLYNYS